MGRSSPDLLFGSPTAAVAPLPHPTEAMAASADTLAPYEVPPGSVETVARYGLAQNIAEMKERGYTILHDCASEEFNAELRDAILRRPGFCLVSGEPEDDIFIQAAANPKIVALAEVLVGQGCILSQVAGSVKKPTPPERHGMSLHSDQNWLPAPFPEHNQIVTGCFVLSEDYTLENGATCLVRSLGSALVQQSET